MALFFYSKYLKNINLQEGLFYFINLDVIFNVYQIKVNKMFVWCIFLGIGIGFLIGQLVPRVLIGMGKGFIVERIFDKKLENLMKKISN